MTRNMMIAALAVSAAAGFAASANADLLAHWNFNNSTTNSTSGQLGVLNSTAPDSGTGTFTIGGPGMSFNTVSAGTGDGTVGTFGGTTLNAVGADVSGGALTVVGAPGSTGTTVVSNGGWLQWELDMTGYQDLVVSFATRGTSTGFDNNQLSWSTDGTTFTDFDLAWSGRPTSFFIVTRDLTSVTALNNDSSVFVRITLNGATSGAGNNRFDNVQFNANPIPAPGALALLGLGGLAAARRRRG